MKKIFRLIFHLYGWKFVMNVSPEVNRSVMIGAPHTSNWDFIFGMAAFDLMKIPVRFTIKKEWMKFPFNVVMNALGAIPIDRSNIKVKKGATVEAMANLFKTHDKLVVLVTPEGTRSRREKWRTGFYYTALKAEVPIALGFMDYQRKVAGVGKLVYPTGNIDKDMQEIMEFYKNIHPRFPEKFSLDTRFNEWR